MNKLVLAIVITMTTTTVLFFQNCSNSFESQAINHNYNSSENNNDEISSISDSGTLPTFSISSKYKEDQGIKNDPDVILFSDFENDFLKTDGVVQKVMWN